MAVKLHIIADTYGEALSVPFEVPDGHVVTVRRHSQGADVFVVPGTNDGPIAGSMEPLDRLIAVHGFKVERTRPGVAEVVIVDGDGVEWRLFLSGDLGLDLASCLRGGEPSSSPDAREAALAELEVAAMRRAQGSDPDAPLVAHTWSVEEVKDANGSPTILLRLHGDGRAIQGRFTPYLAASLSGCLSQIVAKALAEPKGER